MRMIAPERLYLVLVNWITLLFIQINAHQGFFRFIITWKQRNLYTSRYARQNFRWEVSKKFNFI